MKKLISFWNNPDNYILTVFIQVIVLTIIAVVATFWMIRDTQQQPLSLYQVGSTINVRAIGVGNTLLVTEYNRVNKSEIITKLYFNDSTELNTDLIKISSLVCNNRHYLITDNSTLLIIENVNNVPTIVDCIQVGQEITDNYLERVLGIKK